MLTPVELSRELQDIVYQRIRSAILDGQLRPGERLVEDSLAATLNVSRAPVRDALKALEHDGLVTPVGRRGKAVVQLSVEDAWEVYTLRSELEAMAVSLVISRESDVLKRRLAEIVGDMANAAKSKDTSSLSALDVEFHRTLCAGSEHSRLIRAWESMYIQTRLLSQQVIDTRQRDLGEIPRRHQEIIDALESGSLLTATDTIRSHITSASETIIKALTSVE